MRFMLDTNVCIALIRRKSVSVLKHLQALRPGDVCISVITLSELEYGVAKSGSPERNQLALTQFMAPMAVLPYGDTVAPVYGRIRQQLESKGVGIGALDTLIAAHALSANVTLVTNNTRDFERVVGLRVVDWMI